MKILTIYDDKNCADTINILGDFQIVKDKNVIFEKNSFIDSWIWVLIEGFQRLKKEDFFLSI